MQRPQQAAREPERLQLVPNPGVEEFRMVEIQRDMPYVGPARGAMIPHVNLALSVTNLLLQGA